MAQIFLIILLDLRMRSETTHPLVEVLGCPGRPSWNPSRTRFSWAAVVRDEEAVVLIQLTTWSWPGDVLICSDLRAFKTLVNGYGLASLSNIVLNQVCPSGIYGHLVSIGILPRETDPLVSQVHQGPNTSRALRTCLHRRHGPNGRLNQKSRWINPWRTYTNPVELEAISLLTLRPFLGIGLIVVNSWYSYLDPATNWGDEAFESTRDEEDVGIIAKRS